uniref:Uncharacterized protein n=1 Tax=Sinocyclocheilus grahami TaxID=75366 RepID=A0A672MNL9_SINGR
PDTMLQQSHQHREGNSLFQLLSSERRYRSIRARSARLNEEQSSYGRNTYAQHILPITSQPDPVEFLRQQEARKRGLSRKRLKEQFGPKTPEPQEGRKNIDVQVNNFEHSAKRTLLRMDFFYHSCFLTKQQKAVLEKEKETADKIAARAFAQQYLGLKLNSSELYTLILKETGFLPWLMEEVTNTLEEEKKNVLLTNQTFEAFQMKE